MRHVNPTQLQAYLEQAEARPLFLDVREPWEFELCRIEGSINAPMSRIPQAVAEVDPAQEIVVICHHGVRSLQVARFLEQHGFAKVINLAGGIDAWSREIDPRIPIY